MINKPSVVPSFARIWNNFVFDVFKFTSASLKVLLIGASDSFFYAITVCNLRFGCCFEDEAILGCRRRKKGGEVIDGVYSSVS